ncbi:MAG: DNA translocase FtsK 4TM domain-containing protein, partial [Candidatus Omnitrophica bacterium]|nr:DNA translocase FtsK 4TM domain-containing protein [Candidatus Omnitrophota bacterium]
MRERRLNEVKGVILVSIGLMVLASLLRFDRLDLAFYTSHPNFPPKNLLGIFGAYLGGIIVFLFGRPTSFILPLFILLLGVKFFRQQVPYLSIPRALGLLILLLSVSSLAGMFNSGNNYIKFYYAGFLGTITSNFITAYFSRIGGFIIFITFIILSLALVTEVLISSLFINVLNKTKFILASVFTLRKKERALTVKPKPASLDKIEKPKIAMPDIPAPKPKIQIKTRQPESTEAKIKSQDLKIGDYRLPSLDLLDAPPPLEARQIKEDLESKARILED